MTTKEARRILKEHFGEEDDPGHVTFSKGHFTIRRGYFYRHGKTPEDLADCVRRVLPDALVTDMGDHYAPFRGGEGIRKNSYFWVQIKLL